MILPCSYFCNGYMVVLSLFFFGVLLFESLMGGLTEAQHILPGVEQYKS